MTTTAFDNLTDALFKTSFRITSRVSRYVRLFIPFALLGRANAESENDVTNSNQTWDEAQKQDSAIYRDVIGITTLFNFSDYRLIGRTIRSGSRLECFGNLSIALSDMGPIISAASSGSSGALTLLPTAGALIGAPAKELWMLFKLVPLAGILSMLLSLGGNILPNASGDYELDGYKYDGIIANSMDEEQAKLLSVKGLTPKRFVEAVKGRAQSPLGDGKRLHVGIGMLCQVAWVGIIIFACWFTEQGAVVVWWCQAWGCMLGWYLILACSSLLENSVLVPFTKQWTMRVSKSPNGVVISDDAPHALALMAPENEAEVSTRDLEMSPRPFKKTSGQIDASLDGVTELDLDRTDTGNMSKSQRSVADNQRLYAPTLDKHRSDFLHNLEKIGFNTVGRISVDPNEPWAGNNSSFLVIISVSGVSHIHATLRVISKAVSVGVFAAGTATFAATSLITISVALTVLCLILAAGVFGRVASIWMVAEMMRENPVIHRVMHSEAEAASYIQHVLATDGLCVELLGHVFVNSRCVKRYNRWLNWQNAFGILASPYGIENLLTRS